MCWRRDGSVEDELRNNKHCNSKNRCSINAATAKSNAPRVIGSAISADRAHPCDVLEATREDPGATRTTTMKGEA